MTLKDIDANRSLPHPVFRRQLLNAFKMPSPTGALALIDSHVLLHIQKNTR